MEAPQSNSRKYVLLLLGALIAVLSGLLLKDLPGSQRVMASIFIMVVFYWITEPVPIYVTGILASLACGLLLGPLAHLFGNETLNYRDFLYPFASPVVVLMFGGFVMARVFSKNNLDLEFCRLCLSKLGTRPGRILFGMMILTAIMSMWMSNTATTAIMVASILPIVRALPRGSNLARAFMLAIPFSANIGGIATPIGTPPNAIAIGLMADQGLQISFIGWMVAAFPLMLVLLVITFFLIRLFFPLGKDDLELSISAGGAAANRNLVYSVFGITVLLWLTDYFHHIPSALVALVPVSVFTVTGLFKKEQLRDVSWDILLLIGGGLALGVGIKQTGLGLTVVQSLALDGLPPFTAMLIMGTVMALLATFISNTASSNIILPLAMMLTITAPAVMSVTVALCASFGMSLPISTPPNAIAYGSGLIETRDMAKVGALVTIVGVLLTVAYQSGLFKLFPAIFPAVG
ncbi:MAG: DASS family sodium-coupled anion symporter [bacterium]|nr:DASS family sodium-coupled anion symporter [bacterium]